MSIDAPGPNEYSRAELETMVEKMHAASHLFYRDAVRTGCHAFIEFTGLMNEFIQLCERQLARGRDFNGANIHSGGEPLPMQEYHRRYLREKLECIYGRSLEELLKGGRHHPMR